MVFITGDCHADFQKFHRVKFPAQRDMTKDDTVIVCGDFGIWHDNSTERSRLRKLSERPFTTVFVDGNHENFDRLYSDEFKVVDFHGGKAHKINNSIYHLMRGNVYEFDGKKFFAFGGASSHDIEDGVLDEAEFDSTMAFENTVYLWRKWGRQFRINHLSWWEQELPSQEEMDFGLQNLEKNGNEVDYIITHCCPQQVAYAMGFRESDNITRYFNTIAHTVKFKRWYFGHYHREETNFSKFVCLYNNIERVL